MILVFHQLSAIATLGGIKSNIVWSPVVIYTCYSANSLLRQVFTYLL